MQISIRLAQLLKARHGERGLIREIEKETNIDRHTISAMLNNRAKMIALDNVSKLSEYLVKHHGVPREDLPGALLGQDPEVFLPMLASFDEIKFCLGIRERNLLELAAGLDAGYIMAADARLHAKLLTLLDRTAATADRRPYPSFHLVPAPTLGNGASSVDSEINAVDALYREMKQTTKKTALVGVGSVKSTKITEVMFAEAFSIPAFTTQDTVIVPQDRACPIMFLYRPNDPQPDSCIGGTKLAAGLKSDQPGIYYEQDNGDWECLPCDKNSDAAFLFYRYDKPSGEIDLACGGFSSRATAWLAKNLHDVASQLGKPQVINEQIHLGLYLIRFDEVARGNTTKLDTKVIRISKERIENRLKR